MSHPLVGYNWSNDYFDNLDTADFPFPNTLWHIKPTPEVALKSSLTVLVGCLGIFLNTTILLVIIRHKWLWTASNCLVGNLALVDLLTLLICPWLWLIRDFHQNYILGYVGCKIEGFLQGTFLLASVGAVILVSYDRLAAAALTTEARITKKAAPKFIVFSWILSAVLSLPWVLRTGYFERQWKDYLEKYCVEDFTFLHVYWHIIITVLVWAPLGLMLITYGAIMWRLERSVTKLKENGKFVGKARSRAMRIAACVLVAALVCRLPYTLIVYMRNNLDNQINSVDGAYAAIWFAANFMIYVNCAVNPLIYGFSNERFRRAMDHTPGVSCCKFGSWCCVCCVIPKEVKRTNDKNTEKIYTIGATPHPEKKMSHMFKHILRINKATLELSLHKPSEDTNKVTKITPIKTDE